MPVGRVNGQLVLLSKPLTKMRQILTLCMVFRTLFGLSQVPSVTTSSQVRFMEGNNTFYRPVSDMPVVLATASAGGDISGAFSNLQVAANAIGSAEIAGNAVTSGKLANGAVNTAAIGDGEVKGIDIGNGEVGNADLATDAVAGSNILDETITGADIADGEVGEDQIADTGVSPGTYGTEINHVSVQINADGRIVAVAQHAWDNVDHIGSGGGSAFYSNADQHEVDISASGASVTFELNDNLVENSKYWFYCYDNATNTITFTLGTGGAAIKLSGDASGALTSHVAAEGAHCIISREGGGSSAKFKITEIK